MEKGNGLWATMLLEPSSKSSALTDEYLLKGIPTQIKYLIVEYDAIFQTPLAMPPSRVYDHAITLQPNAAPMNCRPYRYSAEQKNEIERQVNEMLKSGLIVPSLSPYASPILLVKKKDNSWRFCVDYKKLNSWKFPLPIINEFLDEIVV
jgi:hypothetical protein